MSVNAKVSIPVLVKPGHHSHGHVQTAVSQP